MARDGTDRVAGFDGVAIPLDPAINGQARKFKLELFGLRLRMSQPFDAVETIARKEGPAPAPREMREVFWPTQMDWIATQVWDGQGLRVGDELRGPAVVELPHTSVALAPGQELKVDRLGNYVVSGQ